jgi:pyruvate/2-oxoglutarate dehydrogenase complex dihydrolipoamide acyltransferase (E2) component
MPLKVIMPKLGESVVDGTVNRWLKHEGDQVQEFESLLEVETAKVTTEIPSPAEGVLLKIIVQEGETVDAGVILAWIGNVGEQLPEDPSGSKPAVRNTTISANDLKGESEVFSGQTQMPSKELGFVSPVVAKLAAENKLDLTLITGTGENGRITKKDVLDFISHQQPKKHQQSEPAPWETPGSGDLFKPTVNIYPSQPTTSQDTAAPQTSLIKSRDTMLPMTTKRKAIADHMIMSKHTSAHVTTIMEADLSRIITHKLVNQQQFEVDGLKLTFTPYFVASAAQALAQFPLINSSWSEKGIILHHDINIGMAVSLGEDGLIVPIIRNADRLSLSGLARAVNDLSTRARSKKLSPDETTGGTFSITNHGTGRSLFATPIINQPQCSILGVGAITKRAVVVSDAIAIRSMVYLSLTFDHRILDGNSADAFLSKVVDTLENWQ